MSHFLFYPNSLELFDKRIEAALSRDIEKAAIAFQEVVERYGYFPPQKEAERWVSGSLKFNKYNTKIQSLSQSKVE